MTTFETQTFRTAMTEHAQQRGLTWLNLTYRDLSGSPVFLSALVRPVKVLDFDHRTNPSKVLERAVVHAFGESKLDAMDRLARMVFLDL